MPPCLYLAPHTPAGKARRESLRHCARFWSEERLQNGRGTALLCAHALALTRLTIPIRLTRTVRKLFAATGCTRGRSDAVTSTRWRRMHWERGPPRTHSQVERGIHVFDRRAACGFAVHCRAYQITIIRLSADPMRFPRVSSTRTIRSSTKSPAIIRTSLSRRQVMTRIDSSKMTSLFPPLPVLTAGVLRERRSARRPTTR